MQGKRHGTAGSRRGLSRRVGIVLTGTLLAWASCGGEEPFEGEVGQSTSEIKNGFWSWWVPYQVVRATATRTPTAATAWSAVRTTARASGCHRPTTCA